MDMNLSGCRFFLVASLTLGLLTGPVGPGVDSAQAEMSRQERLDMKRRVQRQVERGQIPQATRDMPYEQRLYIKRKQQSVERERFQAAPPPAPAGPFGRRIPDGRLHPADRSPFSRGYGYDHRSEPGVYHYDPSRYRPGYRSSYRSYSPYRSYYRGPGYYGPSYYSLGWRQDRCGGLWGGSGYSYGRCMDGYQEYLYPAPGFGAGVVIEAAPPVVLAPAPMPAPPVMVEPGGTAGPASLVGEQFPVWFGPQVTGPGVVSVEDPDRNRRAFHLLGIRTPKDSKSLKECITRYLTRAQVHVNEVAPASRYRGADAEAVMFVDDLILNLEILSEGCAAFDTTTCKETGFDACGELSNAETVARINRVGIWKD